MILIYLGDDWEYCLFHGNIGDNVVGVEICKDAKIAMKEYANIHESNMDYPESCEMFKLTIVMCTLLFNNRSISFERFSKRLTIESTKKRKYLLNVFFCEEI